MDSSRPGSIVCRACCIGEDPTKGLYPKAPTAQSSLSDAVEMGSSMQSQYISATWSPSVALYFGAGGPARTSSHEIVDIDLNEYRKSGGKVHDVSNGIGMETSTAYNFARAADEVLLEGNVPRGAISAVYAIDKEKVPRIRKLRAFLDEVSDADARQAVKRKRSVYGRPWNDELGAFLKEAIASMQKYLETLSESLQKWSQGWRSYARTDLTAEVLAMYRMVQMSARHTVLTKFLLQDSSAWQDYTIEARQHMELGEGEVRWSQRANLQLQNPWLLLDNDRDMRIAIHKEFEGAEGVTKHAETMLERLGQKRPQRERHHAECRMSWPLDSFREDFANFVEDIGIQMKLLEVETANVGRVLDSELRLICRIVAKSTLSATMARIRGLDQAALQTEAKNLAELESKLQRHMEYIDKQGWLFPYILRFMGLELHCSGLKSTVDNGHLTYHSGNNDNIEMAAAHHDILMEGSVSQFSERILALVLGIESKH